VNTTRHCETIEVITRDQRRRRWSLVEKQALVRRTYEPGMSVSLVARNEGVSASLLFEWRKLERQGALTAVQAGEAVVPASELAATPTDTAMVTGSTSTSSATSQPAQKCMSDLRALDTQMQTDGYWLHGSGFGYGYPVYGYGYGYGYGDHGALG
jgi:transposase-like protein